MKSTVTKRSVVVGAHKTSVSLEFEFWEGLKAVAKARQMTVSELVTAIDSERPRDVNLSSAIRMSVLSFYAMQQDNLQRGWK